MKNKFKKRYIKNNIWIAIQLIITSGFTVVGQPEIASDLIPQSPNAYSLGKYGDIPVSHYTGVPNINIPIYSLAEKDVSVDISLSYHASGIKVDELASWVGLGWSLNAGGVITRVVRGRAEYPLMDGSLAPTRTNIDFFEPMEESIAEYAANNSISFQAAETNQTDNEPDIFYYNFGNTSGKFHLQENGNVVLFQDADIKIDYLYASSNSKSKFVITNELGVMYEFSDIEENYYYTDAKWKISAWFLSSIESPSGNRIDFNYQSEGTINNYIRGHESYTVSLNTLNPPIIPDPNMVADISPGTRSIRLLEITSENGSIEFVPKQYSRQDFKGITNTAYALEKIVIKDRNGSPYKVFKLSTSYFEANNDHKYHDNSSTYDNLNYRLKLDELQEFSGDESASRNPYIFSYYGDNDPTTNDPYTLPCRLSASQDHWGYFNDANNNHIFPGNPEGKTIRIDPSLDFYTASDDQSAAPILSYGANRNSNSEAMKANTLEKIQYPTGGYTSFDFEANRTQTTPNGICGGLRIKEIVSYDGTEINNTNYSYAPGKLTNPKWDDYYSLFEVYWSPISGYGPSTGILNAFGLPSEFHNQEGKYILIRANPQAVLNGQSGSIIEYNSVTEYQTGNGRIVYIYDNSNGYPDLDDPDLVYDGIVFYDDHLRSQYIRGVVIPGYPFPQHEGGGYSPYSFPFPEPVSQSWRRGRLKTKIYYSEDSTIQMKESFEYHEDVKDQMFGYKFIPLASYIFKESHFVKYVVPGNWSQLKSRKVIQYDLQGLNPVETITYYDYNSPDHVQISDERFDDGLGNTIRSKHYYYPLDYNTGLENISTLAAKNIIGLPIKVETVINGNFSNGIVSKYNDFGKPYESYSYESNSLISPPTHDENIYVPLNYTKRINSIYESVSQQMVEYSPSNDISTSYIWAFDKTYPIIEGQNVSYLVLQSAVSSAIGQMSGYASIDELMTDLIGKMNDEQGNLKSVWSDFNMYLRNEPSLANSIFTTYTYDPLVGMTSQTDPNGQTTYYTYDELGRLTMVSDFEGNPITKTAYHYSEE